MLKKGDVAFVAKVAVGAAVGSLLVVPFLAQVINKVKL